MDAKERCKISNHNVYICEWCGNYVAYPEEPKQPERLNPETFDDVCPHLTPANETCTKCFVQGLEEHYKKMR